MKIFVDLVSQILHVNLGKLCESGEQFHNLAARIWHYLVETTELE